MGLNMNASVQGLALKLQITARAAQSTTAGSVKRYLGLYVELCLGREHRQHASVAIQILMRNLATGKKAHQGHVT
jgi:hypothetical protein